MAIAKKGYFVLDGILYYESSEVPGRRRLVVPQQLRDNIVSENHDAIFSGHFSAKKMLQRLKQYFYWPGMSSMVFKKGESCLTCATTQGQERRQNPELQSIPVGEPFACIGMDFKEMDESYDKTRFALVFQDYLSKWPEGSRQNCTNSCQMLSSTDMGYHQQLSMTAPQNSCPMYYKIQLLFLKSSNYQLLQVTHNVMA